MPKSSKTKGQKGIPRALTTEEMLSPDPRMLNNKSREFRDALTRASRTDAIKGVYTRSTQWNRWSP